MQPEKDNKAKSLNKIIWPIVSAVFLTFVIVCGLFALLAFKVDESLLPRFSLWGTLVFGLGSFMVAMVALIVSLFAIFQKK